MTIVVMPGTDRVRTDAERAALAKLQEITGRAAGLIKETTDARWRFWVRSNGRGYLTGPVPYMITRPKSSEIDRRIEHQLLVRDFVTCPPKSRIWQFTVLEHYEVRRADLLIELRAGLLLGSKNAFSSAGDADHMRFWIDVDNELGADVCPRMDPGARGLLDRLSLRAKEAYAAAMRARREALNLDQPEFAKLAGLPVEKVAQIENGDIALNLALLNQIETTFVTRERYMLLHGLVEPLRSNRRVVKRQSLDGSRKRALS